MKSFRASVKNHPVLSFFALVFIIGWGGILILAGRAFLRAPRLRDLPARPRELCWFSPTWAHYVRVRRHCWRPQCRRTSEYGRSSMAHSTDSVCSGGSGAGGHSNWPVRGDPQGRAFDSVVAPLLLVIPSYSRRRSCLTDKDRNRMTGSKLHQISSQERSHAFRSEPHNTPTNTGERSEAICHRTAIRWTDPWSRPQ